MKKVNQRRLPPSGEPIGDCFSACIASIMEVPLQDVPVFSALPAAKDGTWVHAVNDWLRMRGYCIVGFDAAHTQGPSPECFHIASGPIEGYPPDHPGHAVVVYGDRLVHDPNTRNKNSILEIRYRWMIVPTDWRHVETPVPSEPSVDDTWRSLTVVLGIASAVVWLAVAALAIYLRLR